MSFSEKLPFSPDQAEEKNSDEKKDSPETKEKKEEKGKKESQDERKDSPGAKKEKEEKKKKELFYADVTEQCPWGGKIIQAFTMASSLESAQHNIKTNYNRERDRTLENFVNMKRPISYNSMSKKEMESLKKHKSLAALRSIGKLPGGEEVLSNTEKDGEYYILRTDQNTIHKATEEQLKEIQSSLLKK